MPTDPTPDQILHARRAAAAILDVPPANVRVSVVGDMGRPRRDVTPEQARAAVEEHGSTAAAARSFGVTEGTIRNRLRATKKRTVSRRSKTARK